MKTPLSWLRDYVDINITAKEFADAMTLSGSKVEGIMYQGAEIENVVVGKIVTLKKHPDADKLNIAEVDVGDKAIQIVTGAQNVKVGDLVPIALVGAKLPGGKKISEGKLRGVVSFGMMCSIAELSLTKEDYPEAVEDGIFILSGDLKTGEDVKVVLGLNEQVVEFEITSNRPDCLSMLGIAREAAVTLHVPLKKPKISVNEISEKAENLVSVKIEDANLCARYAARIVKDVKIAPSPKWMKDRLSAAGIRPINNIVDITNYVMLELGQPMHAFDINNLKDNKIIIRSAQEGEVLHTLDEQERKLDPSMLVIADGKKPVAVAGVMGGANSEINENTNTILFESANFNGSSVRMTAKKLSMRTEASSRFEKGLDVENVILALDRACQLVEEIGAGKILKGIIDCYPKKSAVRILPLRPDKINALLGTDIDKETMIDIFIALEFGVDTNKMQLTIPSFRADVEREADLAEEVARFYGYNKIIPTLLLGKASTQGKKTYSQKVKDIISNTMIASGFSEIYTYSFTSPKVFDRINLPENDLLRNTVVIKNPLGEDFSIMRTTTIPEMLDVISTNYNRKTPEGKFFEMSLVYFPVSDTNELPREVPTLTLGLYGKVDFYDLKGAIEELLSKLGITNSNFEAEDSQVVFHPGRCANILVSDKVVGLMGEVHPEVAENFEAPEGCYIAMIEIEPLVKASNMKPKYKQLPRFPAVERDIAIIIKDEFVVKDIKNTVLKASPALLSELKLFDIYKGSQIGEGFKSVAYSLKFRAQDRTLTDEEVQIEMQNILRCLEKDFNAKLR